MLSFLSAWACKLQLSANDNVVQLHQYKLCCVSCCSVPVISVNNYLKPSYFSVRLI